METLIALILVGLASIVISIPALLLLRITDQWRYYSVIWWLVILGTIIGGIICLGLLVSHGKRASGPTGPFGDAPHQLLPLFGSLSAVVILLYAFTKGFPRKRK